MVVRHSEVGTYLLDQSAVVQRPLSTPVDRPLPGKVLDRRRVRHAKGIANPLHRAPSGKKGERTIKFLSDSIRRHYLYRQLP